MPVIAAGPKVGSILMFCPNAEIGMCRNRQILNMRGVPFGSSHQPENVTLKKGKRKHHPNEGRTLAKGWPGQVWALSPDIE